MSYTNQSLENNIVEIFDKYPIYKLAEKSDEESIHEILESVSMKLSSEIELCYSRRQDLWNSFEESLQSPLIFMDREKKCSMGVLSETKLYLKNKLITAYYASDLRIARSAPIEVRRQFKNCYLDIISQVKDFCYTSILKQNVRALRTLTSKRSPFFYNELCEYVTRTIAILPGPNFSPLNIAPVTDQNVHLYKSYVEENKNKFLFSHQNIHHDHFLIQSKNDKSILGCFSLYRPKNRTLLVKTTSTWIKSVLSVIKFLLKKEDGHKLPWVYMTHLQLQEGLDHEAILSNIIKSSRKDGLIKVGELLLILHGTRKSQKQTKFLAGCPQFMEKAILYQVETKEKDRLIKGPILLDPTQL
jgi:hypothetical protein